MRRCRCFAMLVCGSLVLAGPAAGQLKLTELPSRDQPLASGDIIPFTDIDSAETGTGRTEKVTLADLAAWFFDGSGGTLQADDSAVWSDDTESAIGWTFDSAGTSDVNLTFSSDPALMTVTGNVRFLNDVQFSTAASEPALRKSATELRVKSVDDSTYNPLRAERFLTGSGVDQNEPVWEVDVTGSPSVTWNETEDKFASNVGWSISGDLILGSGSGGAPLFVTRPAATVRGTNVTMVQDNDAPGMLLEDNDDTTIAALTNNEGRLKFFMKGSLANLAQSDEVASARVGSFDIGAAAADGLLRLWDDDAGGDATIGIQAPDALGTGYTLTLPPNDGDANQFLQTNGSGVLTWAAADVVNDTTPQLGGALDVNGQEITGAIDLHSTGDVILELGDASGVNKVSIRDSGAVEVASINSDGAMSVTDTTTNRLDYNEQASVTNPAATKGTIYLDSDDNKFHLKVADEGNTEQILVTNVSTETLTNKTLTTPTISGAISFPAGTRQTFAPNGTTPGLNVGSQAGDPSTPSNGDIWYDSTANTLDARINGATVNLGGGGYTMAMGSSSGGVNPAASSTYYFGAFLHGSLSLMTDDNMKMYVPATGTITRVDIYVAGTTASSAGGSGMNFTVYGNAGAFDVGTVNISVTGVGNGTTVRGTSGVISQAVTAGDFISIKVVTPAWSTPPTALKMTATVFIQ